MRVSSAAVLCFLYSSSSSIPANAFITSSNNNNNNNNNNRVSLPRSKNNIISLFDANTEENKADIKGVEKQLRKEIAKRNSIVENEEQYAVLDGERVAAAIVEEEELDSDEEALSSTDDRKSLEARLKRLVKKRAYPLFLAEKAFEIGEKIIGDIQKETLYPKSGKKEKIVVLGTGWGAASFLKDIDTNLYDVTIVSPRNYFVFTPMLAGASVGTVEYRSITEPVREVRKTEKKNNVCDFALCCNRSQ